MKVKCFPEADTFYTKQSIYNNETKKKMNSGYFILTLGSYESYFYSMSMGTGYSLFGTQWGPWPLGGAKSPATLRIDSEPKRVSRDDVDRP